MDRLLKLQEIYIEKIDEYSHITERDESLKWEKIHMASSARIAWMLAEKRGVDPDFAACACAVHDFGRVVTGKQKGHAEAGYEPVKAFLKETDLFNEEEIESIALAVKNHSSKAVVGTPVEEIVKDSDVLDCYWYGEPLPRKEQQDRLERLLKEA